MMTDAEYLFKQDIKEKKAAGRGVFHKKASVKGLKGCRMPSDYLTRKEKNAMNGEVVTWSPKAYYTWEEFKAFPHNIQHDYLKAMCEKYECGVANIITGLFGNGIGSNTSNLLKRRGWSRDEFGTAIKGTLALKLAERIREDAERAHSQVDKFNEKWGLTRESRETDISDEAGTGDEKTSSVSFADTFSTGEGLKEEPDILASYIEFVCTPDKLADLSAVAALFSGADEVSVTIRTVKK